VLLLNIAVDSVFPMTTRPAPMTRQSALPNK